MDLPGSCRNNCHRPVTSAAGSARRRPTDAATRSGGSTPSFMLNKRALVYRHPWRAHRNACAKTLTRLPTPPTALTVLRGKTGTGTRTESVTGGYAAKVHLSATVQPSAVVTVRRSPSSLTGAGTATVRVKAATTAAAGTYAITRKGPAAPSATPPPVPSRCNTPSVPTPREERIRRCSVTGRRAQAARSQPRPVVSGGGARNECKGLWHTGRCAPTPRRRPRSTLPF